MKKNGTISKHQTVVINKVINDKDGNYLRTDRIWVIPKYITSDVTFQLYFGFKFPKDVHRTPEIMQSKYLKPGINFKKYT